MQSWSWQPERADLSARRRYASEQPPQAALSESQRGCRSLNGTRFGFAPCPVGVDCSRPEASATEPSVEWMQLPRLPLLASPEGVAERSESFKIMIASGNHTEIKKLAWQIIGTSEPIICHD